jgi:hypothetical protein
MMSQLLATILANESVMRSERNAKLKSRNTKLRDAAKKLKR